MATIFISFNRSDEEGSARTALKKQHNTTGRKNEIPSWEWFQTFFFFLVRQCLVFIGGRQYPSRCQSTVVV